MTLETVGNIWRCEVTSFRGSFNAVHYYGSIQPLDGLVMQELRLEAITTPSMKAAFDAKELQGFTYHVGQPTERFDTVEEVLDAAQAVFASLPGIEKDLLMKRSIYSAEPGITLAGPAELMATLNELYRAWKAEDDVFQAEPRNAREHPALIDAATAWATAVTVAGYDLYPQGQTVFGRGAPDIAEAPARFVVYAGDTDRTITDVLTEYPRYDREDS